MSSGRRFYQPGLDLLRLLAFLLVFFDHASPSFNSTLVTKFAEAARLGLPLFFILSSYLISELLLREQEQTGSIHLKAFYFRRMLRIWPLYITFLLGIYLASSFGHGYFPTSALLSFLLFAGNWYSYQHGFLRFAVGILWSISIEEQFYLLWPALVKIGSAHALRVAIPIAVTVSAATLLYSGHVGIAPDRIWFNSFVQFGYFAVGSLLALLLRKRPLTMSTAARMAALASFVACFLLLVFEYPPVVADSFISGSGLLASYGLMALASVSLFLLCYGAKITANSLPAYLGRISYGLYVFHLFALQAVEAGMRHIRMNSGLRPFAHLIAAFLLTLLLAFASQKCIEQPFLRLKKRFTFVPSRET